MVRPIQLWLVPEDGGFERRQRKRGLKAQLVPQDRPQSLIGPQCVSLPPAAVEGDHQLPPEPFPKGELVHQVFGRGDELLVLAGGQSGIEQALVAHQAQLLQPGHFSSSPGHMRDLEERRTAPPLQGPCEEANRCARIARSECPAPPLSFPLETGRIDGPFVNHEHVSTGPSGNPLPAHRLTQEGHMAGQRRDRSG